VQFPIRLGKFKSTRILAGASGLLLALTLVVAFVSPVSAVPQLDHQFFGTVSIDSIPAPEGTEVVARIAGVAENFTTAVAANHTYGWSPAFYVKADDPDTTEKEGGNDGDTIEFYVAGTWATNFTFKSGEYNVLNLSVEVIANATLEGHVGLQGLPATNITVRFFARNTTTEYVAMKTHTSTDSSGNFTIGNLTPGSYDVAVKGSTSLSNLESGIDLTAGNATPCDFGILLEGDASGDDYVDGSDFGPLSDAWLSYPGCPKGNWDPTVDFSRDNYIDGADFGLLSDDWLKWGDCFGWSGNWT